MMQPLNQLVSILKPPELFSWQTLILLGGLSWLVCLGLFYAGVAPSLLELLLTVSWLLTAAGGSCLVYVFLKPPQYFSWQTIVLLGLFSWLNSLVAAVVEATVFTRTLLGLLSLLFFAIGVGWALTKHPIKFWGVSLGPWITGAIICAFIFTPWGDGNFAISAVSWPLVSVLVAATPHFLTWNLGFKTPPVPVRQELILLLLLSLLFSSWIEFSFLIQNWLRDYPSLLMDDFGRSGFVYELPNDRPLVSQGDILLDSSATIIKNDLNEMPWPNLERWLLNIDDQIVLVELDALNLLTKPAEKDFWELQAETPPGSYSSPSESYNLTLRAIWDGPASKPDGYYLEKNCRITQKIPPIADVDGNEPLSADQIAEYSTPLANVECELGTSEMKWITSNG